MNRMWTRACGLAVFSIWGASVAWGAPFTFTENFESVATGDSLPAGWVDVNGNFDVIASPVHGSKAAMSATNPSNADRTKYTGNSNDGVPSNLWQDYTITATLGTTAWNTSTTLYWGMSAREQSDGTAYGVRLTNVDSSTRIQLIRLTADHGIVNLQTSASGTTTLGAGETVTLQFSLINDPVNEVVKLSASFTVNDATGVTRSVNYNHPYSSGVAITGPGSIGLIASAGGTTLGGTALVQTWDDIAVAGTAVPEPASVALLSLGALGMRCIRRRS